MPLCERSSQNCFNRNVSAEVKAEKPIKQAVSIAYSVKRKAKAKGK